MNFVGELAELFSEETIAISADDKNKVNVGTLAVSRHFSINSILYLPRTISPTTPFTVFLIPMPKLFQLDIYYLDQEIGDRSRSFAEEDE